ncbi:MAG: transposase [Chloroflexota bacterium]|nr:transposase [Chloroflexota bacterium]
MVDPFRIVRLANAAVTKTRQRVQQETLGHRGWAGDPLYRVRKLPLLGAERLDEKAWERLHDALAAGDPDDAVSDAWTAKEKVRDIYRTDDPVEVARIINELLDWCDHGTTARAELATLAKTIRRWRIQRPCRGSEPYHQVGQAIRPRVPQLRQLPAPHPPRRRPEPHLQDSPRHEHPHPPSQVAREEP